MNLDIIPSFLVHDCESVPAILLTYLLSLSLQNYIFRDVLNNYRIVPTHKKGNLDLIENFRPITIVYNFSKVLEIALHPPC